jgi:fructose-bisphosphate aldolase class II
MKFLSYLKKAKKEGWAIGQFNVSGAEILIAIIQAAKKLKSPVIIGTSEGESRFLGLVQTAALVRTWQNESGLPLVLNLDHSRSFDYIKKAVGAGYGAVHFDGSRLLFEENIKTARKIVEYARKRGVLVEGEFSAILGASKILEKPPKIKEKNLTDPGQAREFVEKTGVQSLAVSIGTFHGIEASGSSPSLDFQRLKEIRKAAGNVFLALHGGSGVAADDLKKAIQLGITKVNINTELRLAWSGTLRKTLEKKPKEIVPYKIMPEVIEAVRGVVEEKIKLLGSQNKI